MLLMNNKSPHTVADDLESFLHVLSWVILRFIPNTRSPRELADTLHRVFDYSYEGDDGSAKGGETKQDFLSGGGVSRYLRGHPILSNLLRDLTATFTVRYAEPPSDEEIAKFHRLRAENPTLADTLASLPVGKYEREMAALGSSDWMLSRFAEALADVDTWPRNDKSKMNPLSYQPIPGLKRKSDIEDGPALPRQRLRFSSPVSEAPAEEGEEEES
jgi:hypothetical protein